MKATENMHKFFYKNGNFKIRKPWGLREFLKKRNST